MLFLIADIRHTAVESSASAKVLGRGVHVQSGAQKKPPVAQFPGVRVPLRIYWDADNIQYTKRVYRAFARLLGDVQARSAPATSPGTPLHPLIPRGWQYRCRGPGAFALLFCLLKGLSKTSCHSYIAQHSMHACVSVRGAAARWWATAPSHFCPVNASV